MNSTASPVSLRAGITPKAFMENGVGLSKAAISACCSAA
jgi:hypothetical protein